MLSAAGSPPDDLALQTGFTEWDIETYIRLLLSVQIRDPPKVDLLIDCAGLSLPWAVAACQYILYEPGDSLEERLEKVLNFSGDNSVYGLILMHKLERLDLGTFIHKRDDLPYIVQTAPTSWLRSADPHRVIASRCFRVMRDALCFNICSIETSYLPNSKIKGLQERVTKLISPALQYACTNWAFHLSFLPSHTVMASAALNFLHQHTFHWLEVMSLTETDVMANLERLVLAKVSTDHPNLVSLLIL